MAAADPCDVFRAIAAADQHAPLLGLLGFVQLAFVELHRARVLGLCAAGIEMNLGLRSRAQHQQDGETEYFFHDVFI